jgi:hypothetical protein
MDWDTCIGWEWHLGHSMENKKEGFVSLKVS